MILSVDSAEGSIRLEVYIWAQ